MIMNSVFTWRISTVISYVCKYVTLRNYFKMWITGYVKQIFILSEDGTIQEKSDFEEADFIKSAYFHERI